MLARLLRYTILAQILFSLGVGYCLNYFFDTSLAWSILIAIILPVGVLFSVSVIGSLLARNGLNAIAFRAMWGEFLACTSSFLLRQPWVWKPPVLMPAPGGTHKLPVILVHGFFCNHRIWYKIIPALHSLGHNVLPVNLEPVFTSIDNYAIILEHAVQEATKHNPKQRVILMGHSMGGVVIRAWIRQHGSDRVAGAITLGTPHQGTVLGKTAHSPNARQMAWRSPWLKTLAASESNSTRALFRIANTLQDNIVFPQRLQTLPGIQAQFFEGIGHLQMCVSPPVIGWVMQQIQEIQQQETPT